MSLPFNKDEFLGNIRSGNRRANNAPQNLSYFEVHGDSYTSEYSIELFENAFMEKPTSLRIKLVDKFFVNYEMYSKETKCMGKDGEAIRIENKNKKQGKCKGEECSYFQKGLCSKVGRLYFRIYGLEERGIWCYKTSSRGVEYIQRYLNYMKEKNIDFANSYFTLTLHERNGKMGKVYVPDIKLYTNEVEKPKTQNKGNQKQFESNPKNLNQNNRNINNQNNLYKYLSGKMIVYDGKKIPELIFSNRDGKENPLYMTKESKKDILNLAPGTIISITKTLKNKNNMYFLKDYDVVKSVEKNKKIV